MNESRLEAMKETLDPRRLWLNARRRFRSENLTVVVGSAHKVGSTWIYGLLKDIGEFEVGSLWLPSRLRQLGTVLLEHPETPRYLCGCRGYRIFKTHSYPVEMPCVKYVSIYRDPRDVIVSSIFYLGNIPEEKGGWGVGFCRLSEQDRIREFIEHGEFCLSRLESWFRSPFVCQVRYEDLREDTGRELAHITNWLGLDTRPRSIGRAVTANSFSAKARGRKPGHEDKASFYRKGVSGDWKNYFDEECVKAFKEANEGRWNRLLLEMGYEKTQKWHLR